MGPAKGAFPSLTVARPKDCKNQLIDFHTSYGPESLVDPLEH